MVNPAQLVIPSIFGLFVFLYGLATMNSDIPSMDICNSDQKICPACDFFCDYWDGASGILIVYCKIAR